MECSALRQHRISRPVCLQMLPRSPFQANGRPASFQRNPLPHITQSERYGTHLFDLTLSQSFRIPRTIPTAGPMYGIGAISAVMAAAAPIDWPITLIAAAVFCWVDMERMFRAWLESAAVAEDQIRRAMVCRTVYAPPVRLCSQLEGASAV